jgi:signal transduction histidine kinase
MWLLLRGLLLVFIVLGNGLAGWAQPLGPNRMPLVPQRLDSQRVWLLRPAIHDTTRVKLLLSMGSIHLATDLDSAQWYYNQAITLARRRAYAWGELHALNSLAAAYYYSSDFPAAQRAFEADLRIALRMHDYEYIGHAYLGLGNVATELRNDAQARAYFMRARKAYAACRPRNIRGELLVLHNLANSYLPAEDNDAKVDERQLNQARAYVNQGLRLLHQPNSPLASKLQLQLGGIQMLQHQLDSATATFLHVLKVGRTQPDFQVAGEAWLNLARLAQQQRQLHVALARVGHATNLARRLGDLSTLSQGLDMQASLLAALHRPEAYDTLRRYTDLRDTLLNRERLDAVATAQARFQQSQQQARIRALEQEQRIGELEDAQRTVRTRVLLGGLAVGGLLLAGAGVGAYRRRQQRRDAALRHQLAADLHDDVGTLLSQIALQTDLLQEGLAPAHEQPALWAGVADNSRMAVRQLNDVVWNLDAHNDTVPNLLDRLRDYAHEVLVPTGRDVRFRVDTPGEPLALPATMRRHLYSIYKEALHNILKYAPTPATVTVGLHRQGGVLVLEIVNDGPVPSALPAAGRSSGHGLRNIRTRAAAMGGRAAAAICPTGGFAVRVEVPVG